MVSSMHRLLLRKGRNNRSNSDFQTFFEEFILKSLCDGKIFKAKVGSIPRNKTRDKSAFTLSLICLPTI